MIFNNIMKKILLCLFTLPFLINAQDSCPNAVTIVPNNNYCGTNDHEGSFDDGSYTDNPCEDYYNDGEYWFEYTGNGNALTFDVTSLTSTYSGLFVLDACPSSAPNCIASYTSGSSTNDFTLTTPALTNGQTYYIVMANWGTPYSTDFCLTASESTPPTPPAGCVDATELPCGTTNLSGSTIGTTDVAHETGCSMSNYGTWYTFVGDGQQTTINVTTTSYDIELSVSSGSCGSLTNIACQDDEVSSGTETYTFTTTIGETYYVYIAYWSTTGSTTGDFTISRTCTEAPETPEVTAPGGQVCDDAEAFCSGNYLFPNITDVTEAQSGPEYGCVSNTKNPVWYYMEIENGGGNGINHLSNEYFRFRNGC